MTAVYEIVVDTREQKPLPMPKRLRLLNPNKAHTSRSQPLQTVTIKAVRRALPAADYTLASSPGTVYTSNGRAGNLPAAIIERKLSLDELHTNLFNARRRISFFRCLDAMRQHYRMPVLLLEGGLPRLYRGYTLGKHAGLVVDGLQRACIEREISLVILESNTHQQRQLLGEWVARHLINAQIAIR